MLPVRRALTLAAVLFIAAAVGVVPALAPVPVAAALPTLAIVGTATYDVLPDEGRVAVRVQLTATNRLKNSATKRFFYRTGFVTVLPGASGFKVTGGAGTPKVSVSTKTNAYTNLKIDFGANLAAGKSTTLTLTFDIRDPGGRPDRPIRVSHSLVSFPAWAVATPQTPGASVDVRFPKGYEVTVGRGPLDGPVADGVSSERWSSGKLAKPLDFVADISADRSTDFAETSRSVAMSAASATVLLRAWPDDAAWRDRVGSLVERALPALERHIGVPWPVDGPLAVQEALVRGPEGYAGLFDPAERTIDIAYTASDGIILHELAHAWFNGRLVADRWAAEAFASYYAELAARDLGVDPASPAMPANPASAAIPLNAWGPSGSEPPESETWAYAASLELARQIASRAGVDGLRSAWSKAARGVATYQPGAATVEPANGPPDWRGLLDLLEDNTGKEFTDLWRSWVARPEDLPLLADRAIARDELERSVSLARGWALPPATRQAMRAWQFNVARELLAASDAVQQQRNRLDEAAKAAGATLPDRLRASFEGPGGVAAAAAEANAEQSTVDAIAAAQAARPTAPAIGDQVIAAIGLLFDAPERRLANAHAALTAGDLQTAYGEAQAAEVTWEQASDVGRSRIVSVALLMLALILAGGLVRERRRRRSQPAPG